MHRPMDVRELSSLPLPLDTEASVYIYLSGLTEVSYGLLWQELLAASEISATRSPGMDL